MSDSAVSNNGSGPAGGQPDPHRWLVLGVIALAQLMIVLDATIMNIALPTAQQVVARLRGRLERLGRKRQKEQKEPRPRCARGSSIFHQQRWRRAGSGC